MTTWAEVAEKVRTVGDPRTPGGQTGLLELLVTSAPGAQPTREEAQAVVKALADVDRTWLVALGEHPDHSRSLIDQAARVCQALRSLAGTSTMAVRNARVELCGLLGESQDAIEQLRTARLFSATGSDRQATLATARLHDDYSGIIRTTTAVPRREEADPAGTAISLAATLLPYLAQARKVEAEDALMSLSALDVPEVLRLRVIGDQLEYMGLSNQWERGLALLRHTDMTLGPQVTGWSVLNTAIGLSLVLRSANRAGYGAQALGAGVSWTTPWGQCTVTAWDTVVHAYDQVTSFARKLALAFDTRNGNNGVSYRVESRMASEETSLAARSYGTVTATGADRSALSNRRALLSQVRELLVLASGYGLEAVHERALATAETVSESLAAVTDDTQIEVVTDLRIAFSRLLSALGAKERAVHEAVGAAEQCMAMGWTELAAASLSLTARFSADLGDRSSTAASWREVQVLAEDWGTGRMGERLSILTAAIGDAATATQTLTILAEATARGVEEDPSRAGAAREVVKAARLEASHCRAEPTALIGRLDAVEQAVAPYGRGRGRRRRPGGASTADETA